MVRHLVWWTLKPEALGRSAAENAAVIKTVAEKLIDCDIPGLHSVEVSTRPLPTSTLPVEVVLFSTHDDAAALKIYAEHPEHQKLAAILKEASASRQAVDYVI